MLREVSFESMSDFSNFHKTKVPSMKFFPRLFLTSAGNTVQCRELNISGFQLPMLLSKSSWSLSPFTLDPMQQFLFTLFDLFYTPLSIPLYGLCYINRNEKASISIVNHFCFWLLIL